MAVQVSWSALRSRFTEQIFSTSRFPDTINGGTWCHENTLAPVSMGLFFIAQEKVKKEVYQELLTSERMKKEGRTY